MNNVYVLNSAVITALGNSLNENWQRLLNSESAIKKISRFSTDKLEYHYAACIEDLDSANCNNKMVELINRILPQIKPVPKDTVVMWTGIKNNAEFVEKLSQNIDSDFLHFPNEYHSYICNQLEIENKGYSINAACASSTVGLALGAMMVEQGECSSVLVCGADIVSRFTFMGFSALRALSPSLCRPFDKNRDGLLLGDGAGAILLGNESIAREYDYSTTIKLIGCGISNDATHITAPAKDGCGLFEAVLAALKSARLSMDSIEAFCAHGTGTIYNDEMEMTVIDKIFGDRYLPVFSIKGAIGHTLGAAGAIESAISIKALKEKIIPPTVNLVIADDKARYRLSNQPQQINGNNILTTNSGFGGINCALIFQSV